MKMKKLRGFSLSSIHSILSWTNESQTELYVERFVISRLALCSNRRMNNGQSQK